MLLEINNWRCFENQNFLLPDSSFCISDQNGIGKTSILSAIYTLYTNQGWYEQNLKACLRHGQNYFGLKNEYISFNSKLEPTGRLKSKQEFLTEDSTKPLILTYSPIDNQLLSLTRSKKLNFIDQILGQLLPSYNTNLKVLNKLISHKQALIKSVVEDNQILDKTLLHTTNQSIWNFSWYFWLERAKFLDFLNQNLPNVESWLNLNFIGFSINYLTTTENTNQIKTNFDDIYKLYQQKDEVNLEQYFQKIWQRELAAMRCLWGAQRDDFEIYLQDQEASEVLSRGQMRLLVLWLKYLGYNYALEKLELKLSVWWLLDDAFNELDDIREEILIKNILSKIDFYLITSTRKSEICDSFSLDDLKKFDRN